MPVFFQDEYLHCPHCNSTQMIVEDVVRLKESQKDSHELIEERLHCRIRCAECGRVARKLSALDRIVPAS